MTGRVFQDFNENGTYDTTLTLTNNGSGTVAAPVDRGMSGVTVTAYDPAGVSRGTATTISDGTYTLAATGTGPYRIEFTNLPAGYFASARSTDSVLGGAAADSGSTVQFVNNANTANIKASKRFFNVHRRLRIKHPPFYPLYADWEKG